MRDKVGEVLAAYRRDMRLRAEVSLHLNLLVNLAYALFEAVGGILLQSIWTGTLAFYYMVLSVIRFNLLRGRKQKNAETRWKKYRSTGIIMQVLVFALLGIHCITLYMGHVIAYPGYMIYAMATYTTYTVVMAIRNVVIYRKINDPVYSASKALNLAVAAISVYSLQSSLICAFGDSDQFRMAMGNCVGAGVFVLITAISVFMIIKGTQALKNGV